VGIQRLSIKDFLHQSKGHPVLDVRSPAEYAHAHLPGAVSLPLFSDEERKIVGTTYKQQSREQAIKIGLDMFGPKMRKMVEEVEKISNKEQGISNVEGEERTRILNAPLPNTLFLYCWRGGMRSAAVAWLLDLYGFKIYTLAGGYKAFRNHVLQTFQQPFNFKILGGFTGSGKTEVLQELEKNGEPVIDLEKIASHKGSAFGAFKMPPQPSPEMFENLLAMELLEKVQNSKSGVENATTSSQGLPFRIDDSRFTIWLEDESQRIGDLNIPSALWENMRTSPLVFLEVPFEERLNHLTEEYSGCDKEKLMDSVRRISKRLGGLETKNGLEFLEKGEYKEAFRILLHYYDKRYLKGLHNREQLSTLLTKLKCDAVTPANAHLLTKHQPA
jgi:tRNA 2-selenouridine synthase